MSLEQPLVTQLTALLFPRWPMTAIFECNLSFDHISFRHIWQRCVCLVTISGAPLIAAFKWKMTE